MGALGISWFLSMHFQADITITLRPSILDPAGTAVESSLHQLGHGDISGVRMGKLVQLRLQAPDLQQAQAKAEQMCQHLLANPVTEIYQIHLRTLDPQLENSP